MTLIQPSKGWRHRVWDQSLSTSERVEDLQENLGGERRLAASMSGSTAARAAVCTLGGGWMANRS